jgi:hypothetical protein
MQLVILINYSDMKTFLTKILSVLFASLMMISLLFSYSDMRKNGATNNGPDSNTQATNEDDLGLINPIIQSDFINPILSSRQSLSLLRELPTTKYPELAKTILPEQLELHTTIGKLRSGNPRTKITINKPLQP